MHTYALWLVRLGKLKEAEPLLREVVGPGIKNQPDSPVRSPHMDGYGDVLYRLGRGLRSADWNIRLIEGPA